MLKGRTNRLARGVAAVAALAVAAGLTVTVGPADRAAAAARMPVDVRVASYNVTNVSLDKAQGEFRPWRERRDAVVANILGEGVDVIGVQELNPSRTYKSRLVAGKTQFQDLLKGLNSHGGWYALTNSKSYNCKKARTQYKCVKVDRGSSHSDRIYYNKRTLAMVSQGAYQYRAQRSGTSPAHLGWAVLSSLATGSQFLFVTTHLEPKDESVRAAQWDELIATVNSLKGTLPVVVTGDFNTHKMSSLGARFIPAMRANGYGDVLNQQPYVTKIEQPRARNVVNGWISSVNKLQRDVRDFSYWNEQFRAGNSIDWIFASNELPVVEYKTVVSYDPSTWKLTGVIPSNHNMVRATLTLP
jgi:endonuclease/exonuclease/phosphatase family metal-dependent hydrolase